MTLRDDLLKFLAKRKIGLQQAIDILERERELEAKSKKWNEYEKAIPPKYETR